MTDTDFFDEPTRPGVDIATDWRRFQTIFDGLGAIERNRLIALCANYAALETPGRVVLEETARLLAERS